MRKVVSGLVFVVVIAGLSAVEGAGAAGISQYLPGETVEVGPLRTSQPVDREAAKRELADLHAWLMAEQVVAGIERPLAIGISTKELMEMELGICEGCGEEPEGMRVGMTREVRAELDLGRVSWGAVKRAGDGGRVWSAAVTSAGAFGLRLHFDNFDLPRNAELYLFNEAGAVAGPYTKAGPRGNGEFWSHMVAGDTVYLQLRQYGREGAMKRGARYFNLVDVGHVATGFGGRSSGEATKTFCTFNASCVENAECGTDSAVADAKDAVAHMIYVKRPYIYICSGGLLNNTSGDETPYFLTANHCISRDREAGTLEAYFQWTVDCNDTCPEQWADPVDVPSTLGSSVVATNKTGDFTLLLLDEPAPPGVRFLGWSTAPVAYSDGVMLYRISHPSGAPQAYSTHQVDTSKYVCSSWPLGEWIYTEDVYGATEGGSSGSPVVNASGEVVGQLSGGCGFNLNDVCDEESNATVDGAFASYYSQVAEWLAPSGGCSDDNDNDGYISEACGGDDCNDGNALINPGISEVCDDGIDNNCDGDVDEGCGGGECLPRGEPCTTGTECCSGSCHPRKLTCK